MEFAIDKYTYILTNPATFKTESLRKSRSILIPSLIPYITHCQRISVIRSVSSNPFTVNHSGKPIFSLFHLENDHVLVQYVAHKANPNSPKSNQLFFWQNNLLGIKKWLVFFICVFSNLHLYTGVYGIGRAGAIVMTGG